jgi:hypothetical protein
MPLVLATKTPSESLDHLDTLQKFHCDRRPDPDPGHRCPAKS